MSKSAIGNESARRLGFPLARRDGTETSGETRLELRAAFEGGPRFPLFFQHVGYLPERSMENTLTPKTRKADVSSPVVATKPAYRMPEHDHIDHALEVAKADYVKAVADHQKFSGEYHELKETQRQRNVANDYRDALQLRDKLVECEVGQARAAGAMQSLDRKKGQLRTDKSRVVELERRMNYRDPYVSSDDPA